MACPVWLQLREVIFREFAKSDNKGMIFTYLWAFDMQSDWDYIDWVKGIFGLPDESDEDMMNTIFEAYSRKLADELGGTLT